MEALFFQKRVRISDWGGMGQVKREEGGGIVNGFS